jgi:hypothetical protein
MWVAAWGRQGADPLLTKKAAPYQQHAASHAI